MIPVQSTTQSRRRFIKSSAAALTAAAFAPKITAAEKRAPRILLRSSWQTVNIGDIAHTPGVLAILEKMLPEAEIRLWPSKVDNGVDEMLRARFPKVEIVQGAERLKAAFSECEFLLHGSGPSLVAEKDIVRWVRETGKPYGVFGITVAAQGSTATKPMPDSALGKTIEVLSGAKFVFFRDSVSRDMVKAKGCASPVMEFGPDGAFATDLRDDAKAEAFLKANGLEAGKFLCCIPRLRFTPYWVLPEKSAKPDPVKHARNEAMKEHDRKDKVLLIRAARVEGRCEIEVIDHGPGVPKQLRSRLFEPFVSAAPEAGGAGLGLAIARELTRAMGGELELTRTGAEGTTFLITLPAA